MLLLCATASTPCVSLTSFALQVAVGSAACTNVAGNGDTITCSVPSLTAGQKTVVVTVVGLSSANPAWVASVYVYNPSSPPFLLERPGGTSSGSCELCDLYYYRVPCLIPIRPLLCMLFGLLASCCF